MMAFERSSDGRTPAPTRRPPLEPYALRQDFPILRQEVRGHPLVYLDNAASSQRPSRVLVEMDRFYREDYANIHRGVYHLSQRATSAYDRARVRVARFLGAARPEECVFTRGTTEGLNLVARAWGGEHLREGDEVLVTRMEHHSNIVPWQLVAAERGARVVPVPMNGRGELDMAALRELLGPRTRVVAVTHVSNVLGTVNPVVEVCRLAREAGALSVVDGAQAVPHLAVDVREMGCDFYAFSGHKVYGPTGIGVLYGRHELLEAMAPYQGGGGMIRSVGFEGSTWAPPPERFEAGTPPIAEAVGLATALDYLEEIGLERVAAHEAALLEYGTGRLAELPGLRLIGTAREKASVLSFVLDGAHPHDIGTILDRRGIAIRTGHHCAQPTMEFFGVPATARASVALYNTREDLDTLAEALGEVIRLFR